MVSGFNSPGDEVVLVVLEDISSGATLYMTDRAWDGESDFIDQDGDGTIKVRTCIVSFANGELLHYIFVRFTNVLVIFLARAPVGLWKQRQCQSRAMSSMHPRWEHTRSISASTR